MSGMVEVSAVVNGGLLGWRTTEDFRLPCIEMGVEVDDSDRAICTVHAAKKRKGDGVVAAQGDDTRESLALLRRTRCTGVGGRLTHEDAVVALLDLMNSPGIVVAAHSQSSAAAHHKSWMLPGHWNVTTIQYGSPAVERVGIERHVVATTKTHFA